MTIEEEKACCACKGVGTALCWAALSNAIIIATALIVLGFGEIWFAVVVIPAIIVLIIGIIFAVITHVLIAKFVFKCLKDKKHHC
ncbi:hypothetical protein [Jeotgalibacillus marinus]|uniref:Uncharacterized protein n=1 Tax=Jeotgalibacillus marinus TaxID=86667 RepID=A0ABV3Q800_9BACL